MIRRLGLIAFVFLLSACASVTTPPQVEEKGSPAVRELMFTAISQLQAGDYQKAQASLERALRIEPNNAGLWLELARVKREQGDVIAASNFAKRARSLTRDPQLLDATDQFIESL